MDTKTETPAQAPAQPGEGKPQESVQPAARTLESFTPEELKAYYDKSPEIFQKAGIAPVTEAKPKEEPKEEQQAGHKPPEGGTAQPDEFKDLKLPEGVPMDEEGLKKVKEILADDKLSKSAKLQKLIDLQAEGYKTAVAAAKLRDQEYENLLRKDPGFGANYDENMKLSQSGLTQFDKDGSVAKRLVELGVNKDPVLTRYFRDVGRAASEAQTHTPDHRPNQGAEDVNEIYRQRYNNSPEMFEGTNQS